MAECLRCLSCRFHTGVPLDLDLDIVSPGRKAKALHAEVLRPLTAADMALLETERGIQPTAIQRITDRHHALARCLASSMSVADACAITGYTPSRISILKDDPAFKDLVEFYRGPNAELARDYVTKATIARNMATDLIIEKLESEPDTVGLDQAVDIAKTFADRSGHGPQSRTTNVNVNVNLADRLSAARKRVSSPQTEEPDSSGPLFLELKANG
jgi:hypothetical protein